jgi:hypothetical protein
MIKIGLRKNLLYPLLLIIFTFFRRILSVIISEFLEFESSLSFLTLLMFFSEFITGLIIYIYQLKFLKYNKKRTKSKNSRIKYLVSNNKISYHDSRFKVYILIFIGTYFDFVEFILTSYYFPKFENISKSLNIRLGSALTLSSFILYYFLLRIEVFNHQKFSLIIIFVCLLIIILLEIIFNAIYKTLNENNFLIILLIIISFFFIGYQDNIEKYILEFNFINPFKLLMIEGLFGIILAFIYSFVENPFDNIIKFYQEKKTIKFIYLLICLSLFIILSGGRNSYRILTNRLYSPITKAIADSFLDPILILYYFFMGIDFKFQNEKNLLYFIFNLILSIVIFFGGIVYSELLVIYHFNLEKNTHYEVARRASEIENIVDNVEMISSDL